MRGSVLASGVIAVAAALLPSSPAAADDDVLRWTGPPGCDDPALVRARVASRLGRPLDARDAIDAAVEVTAIDGGLRAVLVLRTASAAGERELIAATCADAAEAVAIVVALAVADAPPAPAPVVPVVAPPGPLPARPRLAATAPAPIAARPAWSGGVRAQASTLLGPLPDPAVGVEITGWLAWRQAAVEVSGAAWPAQRASSAAADGAGVDVGLRAAAARLCWRWAGAALHSCAKGELGQLRAEGVGVTDARAGTGRWSALGAGSSAHLRLSRRVLLVASAEAGRALDRPRFRLDDGTVLFRPAAWTAQLGAGIAVAW